VDGRGGTALAGACEGPETREQYSDSRGHAPQAEMVTRSEPIMPRPDQVFKCSSDQNYLTRTNALACDGERTLRRSPPAEEAGNLKCGECLRNSAMSNAAFFFNLQLSKVAATPASRPLHDHSLLARLRLCRTRLERIRCSRTFQYTRVFNKLVSRHVSVRRSAYDARAQA